MSYLVLGLGLLLFWGGWGLGLALWILPPKWRRYLWSVCLPFGISFQIAAVWWTAMAGGTVERVGPWANLFAAILLGTALARKNIRRWLMRSLRTRMFTVSIVVALGAMTFAVLPAAISKYHPGEFTTFSFGSCDAPDYVMGARLFLEKGRAAHGGFWSQTEVHQLADGMTFWTYWTRLNHFGPAALMAMISATFHLPLWQIGTVLGASLGAAAVPLVLGFARFILRLSWLYASSVTVLYLFSPLWLYGVYHVALGQLVGAVAVGCCLLLGLDLPRWNRKVDTLKGVLVGTVVLWLLLSSYAFMIIFVGGIALGVGLWRAAMQRSLSNLLRVAGIAAGASLLCCVLFPTRVWGFIQSVLFFGGGVFGWSVGPMQIQTVIGLPADMSLNPLEADTSIPMLIAFGSLWLWGVFSAWRRRDLALPVVIVTTAVTFGFAYGLIIVDPKDDHLNSYKSYKLVAVFLPILLPCLFLGFKYPILNIQRYVAVGILVMIAMFLPHPLSQMWNAAEFMPLRVAPGFSDLSKEEKNPSIQGVNILPTSTWTRLWVSAFLADKRQFFAASTYVTRGVVPLEGEWTVEDDLHGIYPAGVQHFGNRVVLRRSTDPALVSVFFGPGWWQDEEAHRWSGAAGRDFVLQIDAQSPLKVDLEMDGVFKVPGTKLRTFHGPDEIKLNQDGGHIVVSAIELAAGRTELRFEANQIPEPSRNKRDPRTFLYKLTRVAVTQSGAVE